MITHDIQEGFALGTRLLVFDKVRWDPDYPNAYGASITYDIALRGGAERHLARIEALIAEHEAAVATACAS